MASSREEQGAEPAVEDHILYPPPPCVNAACEACGHIHCGVCWCEDGSAISGGDWSVVCAGPVRCEDECTFCEFVSNFASYASGSTHVCCQCGRNHPEDTPAYYKPRSRDRSGHERHIADHNTLPQRQAEQRRRFEANKCRMPGCTNWGSKHTADGTLVCNECLRKSGDVP